MLKLLCIASWLFFFYFCEFELCHIIHTKIVQLEE